MTLAHWASSAFLSALGPSASARISAFAFGASGQGGTSASAALGVLGPHREPPCAWAHRALCSLGGAAHSLGPLGDLALGVGCVFGSSAPRILFVFVTCGPPSLRYSAAWAQVVSGGPPSLVLPRSRSVVSASRCARDSVCSLALLARSVLLASLESRVVASAPAFESLPLRVPLGSARRILGMAALSSWACWACLAPRSLPSFGAAPS